MPSGTPVSGPFSHLILGEGGRLFSLCHSSAVATSMNAVHVQMVTLEKWLACLCSLHIGDI